MSWRDEYEQAKRALNNIYDQAETEAERDLIEAKQMELIRANMHYLVEQMQQRATEMLGLIQSLELVIKPNASGKITGAAKKLKDVLDLWRNVVVPPADPDA